MTITWSHRQRGAVLPRALFFSARANIAQAEAELQLSLGGQGYWGDERRQPRHRYVPQPPP